MTRQIHDGRFLVFHDASHGSANEEGAFGIDIHHAVVVRFGGVCSRDVFRCVYLHYTRDQCRSKSALLYSNKESKHA